MYATPFIALLHNRTIWVALSACASAQVIKVLIEYTLLKKVNRSSLVSTGGMPSSHSAFVVALAASVGMVEGLQSSLFAISAVFALIVMYDATGVRRAAGKHAEMINRLTENLHSIGIKPHEKLKELLGHSPIEVVAGAFWGIIVASIAHGVLGV